MHLLDVAPTVLELLGIDVAGGDARPEPARGSRREGLTPVPERGGRLVNPHAAPFVRFWWLVAHRPRRRPSSPARRSCYHIEPTASPKLTERTPPSYSAKAILMLTSKEQPLVRVGVTTVTPRGPAARRDLPTSRRLPRAWTRSSRPPTCSRSRSSPTRSRTCGAEEVGDLPGTVHRPGALRARDGPQAASSRPTSRPSRSRPNRPRPQTRFSSFAARSPRSEPGSASSRTRRRCRRPSGSSSSSSTRRQLPRNSKTPYGLALAGRRGRSRRLRPSHRRPAPARSREAASEARLFQTAAR